MKANKAGRLLEDLIASHLRAIGVTFTRQQVIGRTIYDTDLRADFVLTNLREFPTGLVVESKWQDVGGSVDEKFPYLVANIQQRYPLPVLIIVHGGGVRDGAVQWLRAHCDGQHLIAVCGLEEFISWANRSETLPACDSTFVGSTEARRRV